MTGNARRVVAGVDGSPSALSAARVAAGLARRREMELRLVHGLVHSLNPEYALVEQSRTAGLVVVGSRGRGGFTGPMLGSTSQALVHHAHCPVAVAHGHDHQP